MPYEFQLSLFIICFLFIAFVIFQKSQAFALLRLRGVQVLVYLP